MYVTPFPDAGVCSVGESGTQFLVEKIFCMGKMYWRKKKTNKKNPNPPKVSQAKEMSSKCHLNMLWPFESLRCVKLCAGSVT